MPQSISGLTLRRANVSRKGGHWQHEDFEVFEGDREIGRIYRVTDMSDSPWFWGVSFQLTGRKSYGHADSLDDAKAAFKAEYEVWRGNGKSERPGLSPPPARRTDAAASRFGMLRSILWNSCCGWTFG